MTDWQVFPSLREESREGWVWASSVPDPKTPHVLVRNVANGQTVVCEQRLIDANFRRMYNQPPRAALPDNDNVLVASAFYRARLGLDPSPDNSANLELKSLRGPIAGLRAGMSHPSSAIRTATWLGILSFGLGALSVILAVLLTHP